MEKGASLEKAAMGGMGIGMGGQDWVERFMDTPFYQDALAFEAQQAEQGVQRAQRRAEDRQAWAEESHMDVQRAQLESQLAGWKLQEAQQQAAEPVPVASGGPPPPGAEGELPPVEPPAPEMNAPAPAAAMQQAPPEAGPPAGGPPKMAGVLGILDKEREKKAKKAKGKDGKLSEFLNSRK